MKKLVLILVLTMTTVLGYSQTFTGDVVKRNFKAKKDTTLYSANYKTDVSGNYTLPLTMRTPALQLTFTQVEKVDGEWRLTTPILIGYSYLWSYANGVIHQDSSMTVENQLFFGLGANFGVAPNPTGSLITSLPVGAIVGYSRYGFFGGYDLINEKPVLGVSINLINFPLLQNTTRFAVRD